MAERGDETGTEFLRPADEQKGCSLLSKVPFEIRQRIWRMLLKSEDNLQSVGQILYTSGYFKSNNSVDKSIATFASRCNPTAQILLTCQQTNKEGADILYREKEVILWLSPRGGIYILGSARNQEDNSFAWSEPQALKQYHTERCLKRTVKIDEDYWLQIARRFEKIYIAANLIADIAESEKKMMAPYAADCVAGKHITVDLTFIEAHHGKIDGEKLMKSFRVWRCASVKVLNAFAAKDQRIKSAVKIIESDLPALKLLAQAKSLTSTAQNISGLSKFMTGQYVAVTEFWKAVQVHDEVNFKRLNGGGPCCTFSRTRCCSTQSKSSRRSHSGNYWSRSPGGQILQGKSYSS